MATKSRNRNDTGHIVSELPDQTSEPPVVFVDYERYAHLLEHSDASEEEKRAFLQALWEIVCQFVALGYGVHPVQQVREACGKLPENRTNQPLSGAGAVECEGQTQRNHFNDAAGGPDAPVAETIRT